MDRRWLFLLINRVLLVFALLLLVYVITTTALYWTGNAGRIPPPGFFGLIVGLFLINTGLEAWPKSPACHNCLCSELAADHNQWYSG